MEKKEKRSFYFILFFLNKPPADGRAVIELLTLLDVAQPHRHTHTKMRRYKVCLCV